MQGFNLSSVVFVSVVAVSSLVAAGARPTPPANLAAPPLARTASSLLLVWDWPPVEDFAAFEILRDGVVVGTSARRSYTATNLPADTESTFTVRVRNRGDVRSESSAPVVARTRASGRVFNVRDHGAKGDGVAHDTAAIQAAIAACTPGGTVLVPPGTYQVGHLELKGDMTFELAEGALLQFLGRDACGDLRTVVPLPGPDGEVPVECGALITARGARNLTIAGRGRINANGPTWWSHRMEFRPFTIEFIECADLFVQGITIEDPPFWNTHVLYSDRVVVNEATFLKVSTQGGSNGDGLNPDSSRDVLIVGCRFGNQDDSIAVKAGKVTPTQSRRQRSCERIEVRDCLFDGSLAPGSHPLGFAVGSESCGGIRHVRLHDCEFRGAVSLANIKSTRERDRGLIEDVLVENCTYTHAGFSGGRWIRAPISLDLFYGTDNPDTVAAQPPGDLRPRFRDIRFRNLTLENPKGWVVSIQGLAEQPVRDVTFENVRGAGLRGFHAIHAVGLTLRDVKITATEGTPFDFVNVTGLHRSP